MKDVSAFPYYSANLDSFLGFPFSPCICRPTNTAPFVLDERIQSAYVSNPYISVSRASRLVSEPESFFSRNRTVTRSRDM